MISLAKLENLLDFKFSDPLIAETALTHRSYSKINNERLEFLGDSILNFTIAAELFRMFPNLPEGDLSRLRSSLVDKQSLAKIALTIDLGGFVRLGGGELKTGGWRRDSILADAVEAILGAVYIDAGIEEAQSLILRLYDKKLNNLPSVEELKDSKTRLQEWLQSKKHPLPQYVMVSVSGRSHDQTFTVECRVESQGVVLQAQGKSRRKAEQEAARLVLDKLQSEKP